MTAREVLDSCIRHFILVKRQGENIGLEALFPEDFPIPADLIEQVREHKPEILVLLAWREHADRLLLDSTRRIAVHWPAGYPLEGPEWEAHEQRVHDAYWSADLDTFVAVLDAREDYALTLFHDSRNEVTK